MLRVLRATFPSKALPSWIRADFSSGESRCAGVVQWQNGSFPSCLDYVAGAVARCSRRRSHLSRDDAAKRRRAAEFRKTYRTRQGRQERGRHGPLDATSGCRDDESMPVICPTCQIFLYPSNARMTSRKKPHARRARFSVICPVQSHSEKYSISVFPKSILQAVPSRPTGGAYRDRHGRGMRCGGRGSVGRARGRRADCSP
jgi:hypothetical protein